MKTREELLRMFEGNKIFFPKGSVLENKYRDIYVVDILAILAAPTEKQTKCEYCHGEADLNDTANSSFQLNLDMEDEHDPRLAVTYEDEFCDYDSVPIGYCPMCGRKLGDE